MECVAHSYFQLYVHVFYEVMRLYCQRYLQPTVQLVLYKVSCVPKYLF